MNAGCFLGEENCQRDFSWNDIICYADDIALSAPSAIDLQKILDELYLGVDYLGLTVNVS